MNIFVGNLSYEATEDDLKAAFEQFGNVKDVRVITDRYTNRPRGFGFVEMPDNTQAQEAVDGMNDAELKGRRLRVNEARPRR